MAYRGHSFFLHCHRLASTQSVFKNFDLVGKRRRRPVRDVPCDSHLTTGALGTNIRDGRLIQHGKVRLLHLKTVEFVPIQRYALDMLGQVIGTIGIFNGRIFVVCFRHDVHHHIVCLVNGDRVRFAPAALFAEVPQTSVQRPDHPSIGECFNEATVASKRCRRDGQTRHANHVPATLGMVLDPASYEGVVRLTDRLPHAGQHRIPPFTLDKRPDFRAHRTAAALGPVVILNEEIRCHVCESHGTAVGVSTPEGPHISRSVRRLDRLIEVRAILGPVRRI